MIRAIKKWWASRSMSPLERYLAGSSDLVELERRQKNLLYKGKYFQ